MKFKALATMALGLSLVSGSVKADDAKKVPVAVTGYVDAYYLYNFNGIAPVGRVFDVKQQSFILNAAKLSLSSADKDSGTSGQVDLLYGQSANIFNGTGPSLGSAMAIEQAFLTQAFGPLNFKLGKFLCFFGEEVADSPGNLNYSRSMVYANQPYYHTGLLTTYSVMDGLALSAYVGDGSSLDTGAPNVQDFGAQIAFSGIKNLSLTGTYYNAPTAPTTYTISAGPPVTTGSLRSNIHTFDFLASLSAGDSLSFVGEYLYNFSAVPSDASQTLNMSSKNQGYALYVDYKTPIAGFSIDPRFEQYFWPDLANQTNEITLTFKYAKGPLTHYLEFREDANANTVYQNGLALDGNLQPAMQTTQNTLTYAAVYNF